MVERGKYDRDQSATARRREQRAALLAAAASVFATSGFAGASVEAIVSRAKMSRRTFYVHFKDLRDAFQRLYATAAKFAVAQVAAVMAAEEDPVASVDAGIRAFLELSAGNADLARVLFREVRTFGEAHRREALEDEFAALLLAALRRAHRRGQIAVAPDALTVTALVGAIESLAMRLVDHGEERRLRDAAPALLRMTLNAFR